MDGDLDFKTNIKNFVAIKCGACVSISKIYFIYGKNYIGINFKKRLIFYCPKKCTCVKLPDHVSYVAHYLFDLWKMMF